MPSDHWLDRLHLHHPRRRLFCCAPPHHASSPPPATFAGIKAPIALAKTPSRIYLISGVLTQLVLAPEQFAFLQGFSTLRSISLCIVDAVLTSLAIAGLMSFVLMIQISATALAGIRAWLEQHIAKREAAGAERTTTVGSCEPVTVETFMFDKKDAPPKLDLAATRPGLFQRKTEDLKGFEDGSSSSPFNVRKEGSIHSTFSDLVIPQDPFRSSEDQLSQGNRRTYNPEMGGYQYEPEDNDDFFTVPVWYKGTPTRPIYGGNVN